MNRKQFWGILSLCLCAISGVSACDDGESSSSCGEGQMFVNGECKPKTPETGCDPECEGDTECVDGECQPKTPETGCDPECEGDICIDGVCTSDVDPNPVESCKTACPEGQICQDGECIEVDVVAGGFEVSQQQLVTIQTLKDDSFTVYLTSKPTKKVTISIQSKNEKAGTLSAKQVELTSDNWEAGESITIKAATDKQAEDITTYDIVVGPSQSEDKEFDGLEAVTLSVSHYNMTETLKLDKTEDSLLLRKVAKTSAHAEVNATTFTAILPEGKKENKVTWKIENANSKDKTVLSDIIQIGEDCTSGKATCTISRVNIDLLSEDNLKKNLDWARTISVKASSDGCGSAEANLYLKPYLPTGFNYGYMTSNVKDFKYNSTTSTKGNLSCEYYDEDTLKVLNEDMYQKYVVPNMYENSKGELIPTRASVVAAARFLVLQFPRDIPYSGTAKYLKFDGMDELVKDSGRMTFSSYVWTVWTLPKGKNYKDYQLFGLSLRPKGYNDPVTFDDEHKVASDLESWGCPYEEFYKNKYSKDENYKGKTFELVSKEGKKTRAVNAGLMCSGFVSWAIHNGMFDIGQVYTSVFAKSYDKDGKVIGRRYQKAETLYDSPKINESVNVLEKLAGLKESDFVSLDKIDAENTVGMKAGDLLWYSGTCECAKGKSCPEKNSPEECKCSSGGHLAMILGIYKSKGKISTIYVAEAQDAGNRMTCHYLDKKPLIKDWNSSSICREIKLIKMGNVYNYATRNEEGEAKNYGDTWKYTDNFF